MVVARRCSRPAVLLPAYRKRSVAQPLFCMRSALATPRPRLGQPLRWSHGLWRAPGSQNWQIGLFTGFSRFRYASAYGGFDGSAPRPGPGGAGRDGFCGASVLDAYGARDSRHARIIELKQKRHSGHVLSHFVPCTACESARELWAYRLTRFWYKVEG